MNGKQVLRGALALTMIAMAAPASAALVNFSIQGTVRSVNSINAFGLTVGESVFATAMYDDSLVSLTGASSVSFGFGGNSFGMPLMFDIGSVMLNQRNDVSFASTFPLLAFLDGAFASFNFNAEPGVNNSPVDFETFFFAFNGQDGLAGDWNIESLSITPKVPEPTTLALLGLGLAGFAAATRRKAA